VRRGSVAAGAGLDCAPSAPSGLVTRPLNFTSKDFTVLSTAFFGSLVL
jgi:hypothetical protein